MNHDLCDHDDALTESAEVSTAFGSPLSQHHEKGKAVAFSDGLLHAVWQRTAVLVSLLLLQSLSQFILEVHEKLLQRHVIISLFLTMLVGAGGNAGNQSAIRGISGLASQEFRPKDFLSVLKQELFVGVINSAILAGITFARVYYFYGKRDLIYSTLAVTVSLFFIVISSVVLGTSLPFLMGCLGYSREHAAPMIQVVMDITGVFITCSACAWIIPESEAVSNSPFPAQR